MPFPMKIQPIDCNTPDGSFRNDSVKPVVKSRFKRLFERQFQSVLRISSSEKQAGVGEQQLIKDGSGDLEPSSVCLAKMVQNFIEESNDKQALSTKCGRNRCNCFNGNCDDSSDDELDFFGGFSDLVSNSAASGDACDIIKSLVSCASTAERNLLADTSKIVEMNKICKPKDDCRKIVTERLIDLGYDASICKSRWEKASAYPAGEYEYIDVIVEGDRLIIDIDFRSEFEIARSTKTYRAILQFVPLIFVGKPDRLQQIVSIVSEAAKQSLKKKGMHFPPWRKAEYMRAKWLSSFTRTYSPPTPTPTPTEPIPLAAATQVSPQSKATEFESQPEENLTKTPSSSVDSSGFGELDLIFGEKLSLDSPPPPPVGSESGVIVSAVSNSVQEEKTQVVLSPWQPPAVKPRSPRKRGQIVAGLASILKEKP